MNKITREIIEEHKVNLDLVLDYLNDIRDSIEELQAEEESKYYNLPESLQDSERGEALSSAMEYLGDALSSIEDAISNVEDTRDNLENSQEV